MNLRIRPLAVLVLASLAASCSSSGGGDTLPGSDQGADVSSDVLSAGPDTLAPDPGSAVPDYGEVFTTPDDKAFVQSYLKVLDDSADMTTDQLFAAHYAARPYMAKPAIDPLKADAMDLIDGAFNLTAGEKAMLSANGFVVTDRVQFGSHPLGYQAIWQADLPVLVTTDSILFAIHKSYDLLLKSVEETALIGMLDDMLSAAHAQLKTGYAGLSGVAADAWSDADLYFTVARSLLAGAPVDPILPVNAAKRDELLADVAGLQPLGIELFGRPYPCPDCQYDFSQFKPRGHYTDTAQLQQYFRAMMWLGRTELAPTRFHREFVASWLLSDSTLQAGKLAEWESFDRTIQVFVGKSDNLTMDGLQKFLADHPATPAAIEDPSQAAPLMTALEEGGYADQLIRSQIIMTDPFSADPTPLPPIFEYLGQRFVIDSYVFSNVVYDSIVFKGEKMQRYMPSPLDAMFVLSFQEALPILKPDLDEYHYAKNLNVLRWLVDGYDDSFWSGSMYNVWLDAIRGLSADTTAAAYPDAVRTLAYAHKSMNTALASWAELRHDTILYAKQSYTGVGCDYPDGYVEPFPDFFNKVKIFADTSSQLFDGLDLPQSAQYLKPMVQSYFGKLSYAAGMLASIAAEEVAGQPRQPDETAFLKSIVKAESMCGAPPFSGWYVDLFFNASDTTFEFKPTIADVHTDPNSTDVLHVGTGMASLMVLVANTSCMTRAFAGPVSTYYEDLEPGFARLTDDEWMNRFTAAPPERPAWTSDFVAPKQ